MILLFNFEQGFDYLALRGSMKYESTEIGAKQYRHYLIIMKIFMFRAYMD